MSRRQRQRQLKRRREAAGGGRARSRLVVGTGLSLGATLGMGAVADAATIEVTSALDDNGAGTTLREAVVASNATPAVDDMITFNASLSGDTITLDGEVPITDAVQISGPGAANLTVTDTDATPSRLFDIDVAVEGEPVTISGLTLTGATVPLSFYDGGAIRNEDAALTVSGATVSGNTARLGGGIFSAADAPQTIQNSTLTGNDATGLGSGGGVSADYDLTVADSTVSDNDADGVGGGVNAVRGATITRSTISGNDADLDGGGVSGYLDLTLNDSTITGNTSGDEGGGVSGYYDLNITRSTIFDNDAVYGGGVHVHATPETISHSTIAMNSADSGGGIWSEQGVFDPVILQNTIVADNIATTTGPELVGPFTSSFSLVESTAGTTAFNDPIPGSNLIGQDPQLPAALAANGGPTMTLALPGTSPAVDQGRSFCTTADQRGTGFPRPSDLAGTANSAATGADGTDIGAFEVQGGTVSTPPLCVPPVTPTPTPTPATPLTPATPAPPACKPKKKKKKKRSAPAVAAKKKKKRC